LGRANSEYLNWLDGKWTFAKEEGVRETKAAVSSKSSKKGLSENAS
jgi:hypothetical protein